MDENAQTKRHVWLNSYKQRPWILIKHSSAKTPVRAQVVFLANLKVRFSGLDVYDCTQCSLTAWLKAAAILLWYGSQRREDSHAVGPPQPQALHLNPSFSPHTESHDRGRKPTRLRKKEHVPAVWPVAGLCSGLHGQILLPQASHSQKKSSTSGVFLQQCPVGCAF